VRKTLDATVKHPSAAGTYLAACTFYAAFYVRTPEGARFNGELMLGEAAFLQSTAWETVSRYYVWGDQRD
jgi:hypothetical protein